MRMGGGNDVLTYKGLPLPEWRDLTNEPPTKNRFQITNSLSTKHRKRLMGILLLAVSVRCISLLK